MKTTGGWRWPGRRKWGGGNWLEPGGCGSPNRGPQGTPRCPEAFSRALDLNAGASPSHSSTQNGTADRAGPGGRREKPAAADTAGRRGAGAGRSHGHSAPNGVNQRKNGHFPHRQGSLGPSGVGLLLSCVKTYAPSFRFEFQTRSTGTAKTHARESPRACFEATTAWQA